MEDRVRVMRIDRRSLIETEPITLRVDQIDNAREAAMYVMNTRSVEEVVSIFTQAINLKHGDWFAGIGTACKCGKSCKQNK
ncbi:uncharacterized protein [Euphorbia lathyris]|uniref:uncharacterized protein n=1 Tax=Euphorbia lathyris TaxID=212925 RepID=UPI003313FFC8